ncbi:MAG: asparaginase [Devosia sp.]|uniref:asparaginase n=1 Tax=Devosia sp. TaxID=1871048 RepID=UPI00261B7856|nr:asparaginase [Devosia sp.]MDB5527486.1 asparaginase [Devosia sp.]
MKKIAFIGTGGTIASLGKTPLDILDYGANNMLIPGGDILARIPELASIAHVFAVPFPSVPSPSIYFPQWQALAALCSTLVAEHPDLAGVVIGHGTATLEETAYVLGLTIKIDIPVVLVGSQRPLSALGSDAHMNLLNAVRVAASPDSLGRGVLVVLNDEIHAAREVTKTATVRLQTFRAPDFGMLGYVDGEFVAYYRRTERTIAPNTEFDLTALAALPRVDISYSYAGADGADIDAFAAAGAQGIISAGFAPGMSTPAQADAMARAHAAGVIIMQSSRAGSGVVHRSTRLRELGFLTTDNLNPQKARLLLALALTKTRDPEEIARIFRTY